MTKRETRQYAMLVRVRDFGSAHAERFPDGSEGRKAFATVTTSVADVEAFTSAKVTAKRVSRGSRLAAKRAVMSRLVAIARSARALATTNPGADEKFPLPERTGDIDVLQGGRLFLREAPAVKDTFIRCGLAPAFLDDLQQAVTTFEQAISGRSAGRTGAVVSRKAIQSAIRSGVAAVQSLDAYVANALSGDEAALNAWKRDRHVDMNGKTAANGARQDVSPQPPTPAESEGAESEAA